MEMENRPNFLRNGGLKLPIGYRFRPTDEELVVHYLKRKVHSLPLPASIIPEYDVFRVNPWDLPAAGDELMEKRYLFSRRRKGKDNIKKFNRIAAGCGYWKAVGKEKQIVAQGSNQPLGMKRMLVFYQGKRPHGERMSWIMREYRLLGSKFETTLISTQKQVVEMEDWVVCCIYQKKRKAKKNQGIKTKRAEMIRANSMDFMVEDSGDHNLLGPPQSSSSSSCSSGITDHIYSNGSNDQEATSPFLCFSSYS